MVVRSFRPSSAFLLLLALVAPATRAQDLCRLNKAKMVPLRDAVYRTHQYTLALQGTAIAGTTPFEIHFDTGSWTTSIPGGAVDFSKVKIITRDVTTDWGRPADLVEGQLAVKSVDGTVYSIDNYRFYALKVVAGGAYAPDDRTAPQSVAIMGGFPSPYVYRAEQSFPYLLAQKYAPGRMGMGIVSACPTTMDLADGWPLFDSYLQIGNTPEISDFLAWRTDIPNWQSADPGGFQPEGVPGFQVEIGFTDTNQRIVTANNLISTIDTGAPDLTLRLADTDPQYTAPFASHFVATGPWRDWNNADYNASATTLVNGTVKVNFTDSRGVKQSYQYNVGADPNEARRSPASLYAGRWSGGVPWPFHEPEKPRNRISIGNSIYYFWPVVHYDIQNKRVGIGTAPPPVIAPTQTAFPLSSGMRLKVGQNYPSASGAHYLVHQADGNLVVRTSGGAFAWGLNLTRAPYAKTAAVFLTSEGNLVGLDAANQQVWSALPFAQDPTARLNLTSTGQLQLVSDTKGVLWTSTSNTVKLTAAESAPATAAAHLGAAYPNPFAGSVTIPFTLTQPGRVTVAVYDVLGREVAVLADAVYPAGRSEATWEAGQTPGGVYLYRLQTPTFTEARVVTRTR